jgi:hypothetical protein
MNRTLRPHVLAVLGLLAAAFPTAALANCGAEGCPLASQGPEVTRGAFSFNLGYQAIEQNGYWNGSHSISSAEALAVEGGTGHIVEQLTRTRAWTLGARARLTDRLDVTLALPWIDRVHRHALAHHPGYFIESEWHMQGLGDASAAANWTVLAPADPGSGTLRVTLGAKLPTGKRSAAEVDGESPEPSARPGSGSTDAMFGAAYHRAFGVRTPRGTSGSLPLMASAGARVNGKGTSGYRMGNEWQADLGSSYPLHRGIRLLAQLNLSGHARDDVGETDAEPHNTGGTALFASPGLQADLIPGVSAFGYYQFRLWQHTNGPQLVSPFHLNFGLAYTLR